MALSEEMKRLAREAAAKNVEAVRNREYANPEVQAKDEASRVRVVTPSGVKTGREVLEQFGSVNYIFGADQTQNLASDYMNYLQRHTNAGYVPARERVEQFSSKVSAMADQMERQYQDYLQQKPAYIAGWTGDYKSAGQAKGIQLGAPSMTQGGVLPGMQTDPEWEAGAEALREKAEYYRNLSHALMQENLMENIDYYADQAEQEYQDYIHSEEYVTRTRANARERDERMRMAVALGADPAYMGLFNWESKDEREEELRAIAAYYRNLANGKADAEIMSADMDALSSWSAEELRRLGQFAVAQSQNYSVAPGQWSIRRAEDDVTDLFEKYGEQRVRELAESYLRYQNQQYAQSIIQDAQNIGLPEVDLAAEFGSEPLAEDAVMEEDLRMLGRWSPSEQTLLVQYAANPDSSSKQFQILAAQYGDETVKRVAESYNRKLALQTTLNEQTEDTSKRNSWSMVGHSAASVGANLVGSISSPAGYMTELLTRTGRYSTLDPNNAGMLPSTYAGAVRQTVSEELMNSNHGMAKSVLYQAGMSALDNLARMLVGGKVGSLALAATGSFGSAVQEYSQKGADPVEAVAMGVLRGAVEVLTEKISLDNLLTEAATPKDLEQMMRSILRGGSIEVTEEEFGLVLTTFLEALVLREESGFNQRVAEWMVYGLSAEQAREQACYALLEEALNTSIQSFLSGGMMTGATNVYANAADWLGAGTSRQTANRGNGFVHSSGRDISDSLIAAAERISAATGRTIDIYSDDQGADGYFDPGTGVLHVNAKGVDPIMQIIGHELTHSVEGSAMYQQLSGLVMGRIQQTGGNLEQLRAEKIELYKRNGQTLPDQTAVDREIVASYVASHLLTNEQEITSLVQEQPSVGRRILNWLNDLLAKWGNKNAQEREFIRRARDIYARALDQTQGRGNVSGSGTALTGSQRGTQTHVQGQGSGPSAAQGQAAGQTAPADAGKQTASAQSTQVQQESPEGAFESMSLDDQKKILAADFREGRITEEEFDAMMDAIQMYEEQIGIDGMAQDDRRFQPKESGRQYSIQERPDGKKYVRADRQVIFGNDPDSWSEQVEDYINGKIRRGQDITLTGEDGKQIRITQDTAGKMARMYDGRGRTMDVGLFAVKANAAVHIDEIVQVSEEQANSWKADRDSRHGDFASGGWRYRTAFFQDFDGKYYKLDLSVATGNNGDVAYNIGGINERSFPPVAGSSAKGGALNKGEASSANSVPREGAKVNRKYSIPNRKNAPEDGVQNDSVNHGQAKPKELTRDSLNTKAANKLRHEETVLLNKVGQALYVPYHAKRDTLKPMIQEMTDEYLRTGQISEETKTRIFEAAYEAGVVIDREFFDQYKHIKDHLRTTAITLSQRDRSDVTDYDTLRRNANRYKVLRITEDGGRPVDSFYEEMQEMAPELFPAEITHPADQLQRLFDVSQSIAISESSLNDYYGPQAAEFKAGARAEFDRKLADAIPELNKVRRYGEDRLLSKDDTDPISLEEAEDIGHKLKNARRNYEKVNAKHLLTAHDEMQVGRLLRGETQLEYLQNEENFESIKAVFEAKQEYEYYAQLQARYKRQVRKAKLDLADKYLATANTWKDKKSGILYSRETMRRNIFDIIPDDPKLAEAIVEEYFEPIHKSEAASTRFKQEYRDRVKALGLSRKVNKGDLVSEAHAVQLLGEAADNIRVIENSRGRIKTRDGKTLLEWQAVVQNLWVENPSLDKARIEDAVLEFRKIYDELFQKMNRARLANGYEPVSYRQGYFPHFQPGDGDGIMHYFGKILGIDVSVDNLPTTINGLTHTFKPGTTWFGNAQERLGFNTAFDAVEGFDKYIEGISAVIFHTENIQKLRALESRIRYRTSDDGIREQVDAIQQDTRLTDEERQMKIREIYEKGKFSLANFVVELDEYTNLLANKKSKYDRSMEHLLGRKWYTIMKRAESRVGANMIAGNISSAFTNFIPLTQAMGHFGLIDMAKGARGTLQAIFHKDRSIVGQSDFLTNRRGGDVLVKGWSDKLSDVLGMPMEMIDSIVSETIVRAAYSQNLRRGLSESEAMHQADIAAAGIMADRSKGALPTLFESSNPLIKLFTQFQVEVNNQYSEIFKDMPREYGDRAKIVLALAFFKYFLAAWLWNELEEKLKGRRSALDPIDMAGNFYSDWKEAGAAEAIGNLSVNLIEGLPFTSALAFLGVDIDGGRIPIASAIPDFPAAFNALLGRDIPKNVRMRTLGQEFQKPITYLLMPAGGGQIAKAWKGIQAYREGGSYSLNQDGEEILQYPIYKDTPRESAVNLAKSILFGKSSLSTAQEWVANDFDSLNAEETAIYQDLVETGTDEREAYEALRRVQAVPNEDPKLVENAADVRRQNQANIILNSELSPEAQSVLFYGLVATENEQKLMDQLVDVGSGYEGLVKFVSDFYDIKLWEEDDKKGAYQDLLASSGLTEDEKFVVVGAILGTEDTTETGNLSIYGKFKLAVEDGMTVDNFMKIYAAGASMDTYFDFSDIGIRQDDAVNLVLEMSELKPLPGSKSVSWYQECDVILGSRLTSAEQVRALQVVCNESTGAKVRIGYDNGLPPGALIWLKQLLPDFDANNNGSYTQKEVTAAIDAVSGDDNLIYAITGTSPHGFRLTNEQKAVLWQLQTGAKDGKSNPYDKEIGKLIYDLVQADKAAREKK